MRVAYLLSADLACKASKAVLVPGGDDRHGHCASEDACGSRVLHSKGGSCHDALHTCKGEPLSRTALSFECTACLNRQIGAVHDTVQWTLLLHTQMHTLPAACSTSLASGGRVLMAWSAAPATDCSAEPTAPAAEAVAAFRTSLTACEA